MKKYRKINIFTISSKKLGSGHLIRSLILSKFFRKKGFKTNIHLFNEKKKNNKAFGFNTHKISSFFNIYRKKIKDKKNFIILDISNHKILSGTFIKKLRFNSVNYQGRLLVLDSFYKDNLILKAKLFQSQLILPYFVSSEYYRKFLKIKKKRVGPKFFIFDNKFKKINNRSSKKIKKILLSFGASDVYNSSYKILSNILKSLNNKKITIILGPFFSGKNVRRLKKIEKRNFNIKVENYRSNLVQLINSHDLLITNSGLTKYEFCLSKKPVIIYSENKADNLINKPFINKNLCFHHSFIEKAKNIDKKMSKIEFNFKRVGQMNKNRKINLDNKGLIRIFSFVKSKLIFK